MTLHDTAYDTAVVETWQNIQNPHDQCLLFLWMSVLCGSPYGTMHV